MLRAQQQGASVGQGARTSVPPGFLDEVAPFLPIHLQDCLCLSRGVRLIGDYTEIASLEGGVRSVELRVIERVVSFQTKFQVCPFAQLG